MFAAGSVNIPSFLLVLKAFLPTLKFKTDAVLYFATGGDQRRTIFMLNDSLSLINSLILLRQSTAVLCLNKIKEMINESESH